jgi:leucyl aminopeptidase
LEWGEADAPLLALCGKGVCFDTGGLDLKPPSAMLRMKKDMGGAAVMLALADCLMAARAPWRILLVVGAVENSVSGEAFRPGDVIATRAGLSVEIGNTDAEGRLVLADLLTFAAEHQPALILNGATLTGAARVALGPDLPALFANDDALAAALLQGGKAAHDPLWRLPLHDGYDSWLDSGVADLNNVSSKPSAGAVVAALFLRRFVPKAVPWAHLDLYAWNDANRPGRPEGGEATGLRALQSGLAIYRDSIR